MQCPRCRQDNRDVARFCRECGAAFDFPCAVCGTNLKAESKFCDNCGASISIAGKWQTVPSQSTAAYIELPEHVAKTILSSKVTQEGERKLVTALFADIRGSTELVAGRDPEEARRLLDPILEHMMDAVHRYEGTVNQVMGDGIQALFGAPRAYEDHAIRACYAALRMQEAIKRYAEEVRRTEGIPLQARVGLNSGEVVVRSLGSDLHMNYCAQGETIHLAARMEQMAIPGTILISCHTYRLAERYVTAKPLGPIFVKGLAAPVVSHELLGANASGSRLWAVGPRGLTRFVDRTNETEQLRQALERARAGRGQVVAVVGEPGVGKSRFIYEFIHSGHTDSWRVLQARAVSYGTSTSYLPVTEFLKEYFQITASDEPGTIREKVTSKLLNVDDKLLPTLPTILTLLDIPPDDTQSWIPDPRQCRQRMLEAVKQLLFRESERQPLLVVLEDLQSIDPETQVLIDGLVDSLPAARCLLLISARPEYQNRWGHKTYYTHLRIDTLPPYNAGEMLNALVGTDARLEPIKHLLIEKTQGTPFFLEESVRALVDTGALGGEPEAYFAAKPVSELSIPATLGSLLTSRIDRLSPVDKRLLQCAAVVGNHVPLSILQAVGELAADELRQALKGLLASEFLYEARLFPEIEYTFKHALIHDAAYQMLAGDRRRALHSATLFAGEQQYADQLGEKADWLAFHALRGQKWDRAVAHLQAAAVREITRAANRVAAQHLENALIAVEHLSDPERNQLAIDLRIALRHALTPLGQVKRTLEHLRAAEQLANQLNDRSRLGRVISFTANCLVLQGRYTEALVTGETALNIAHELRDHHLELATRTYMARARLLRGECQTAIEMFQAIMRTLQEQSLDGFLHLPVLPAAFAGSNLAIALAEVGQFEEAQAHATEAARRADASGQPDSIIWAHWSIGLVALTRGASGEAVRVFDRLLQLCNSHDLDAYASRIMAALGCSMARVGQVNEGLLLLQQAVALDAAAEPQTTHSFALTALAEATFLGGNLAKAQTLATQAVQRTRAHEERSAEAHACWLLATIYSACDSDLEAAASALRAADVIARELCLQPLSAHCHLGFADLSEQKGLGLDASAHRERGHNLLEKLGMKPWFRSNRKNPPAPLSRFAP